MGLKSCALGEVGCLSPLTVLLKGYNIVSTSAVLLHRSHQATQKESYASSMRVLNSFLHPGLTQRLSTVTMQESQDQTASKHSGARLLSLQLGGKKQAEHLTCSCFHGSKDTGIGTGFSVCSNYVGPNRPCINKFTEVFNVFAFLLLDWAITRSLAVSEYGLLFSKLA